MKRKKRIIAGMLAAILVFTNMSVNAFATTKDGIPAENEVVSEVVLNNQEEPDSASVSGNEVETEDEEGNPSETESETESTEVENETETETETEEVNAGLERSMTDSFLVDTTAPYDGDYLLIANTNIDMYGSYEDTGAFPATDMAATTYSETNQTNLYGISTENIYAYDKYGRGLIDPASFLPELEVGEAANKVVPLRDESGTVTPYAVGNTKVFYLDNNSDVDEEGYDVYVPVTCVCMAVGTYSTVWVPVDDPIYVKDAGKMQSDMSVLANEFDKQYPKMIEMFGDVRTLDTTYGDGDGKTALVCYDIDGDKSASTYTAGYFFGADLNFNFTNQTGSNCDMLHIDSWQGMDRDITNQILGDVTASKGTIVHEFQHMINFAINRKNEPNIEYNKYAYTIKSPTYINEAFSMAAEHLIYGSDECEDRVEYYNYYPWIAQGNVSLMRWGAYDTLSNYALSYLFGQYIRTQYKNGDTIYRDAMNEYDSGSENLLSIIADLLDVTEEDLLLNFRIALFQKNAVGPYGFKGEEWAESIRQKAVKGDGAYLYPGAAVVVPLGKSHTPVNAGENVSFAGMYLQLTDEDVSVSVSGGTSIATNKGTLQLSATVSPSGVSQAVTFELPNESDRTYATVTKDGLVTALANGKVTVRARSVYNPEKYADVMITISGQQQVALKKTEKVLDEGYHVRFTATEPTNAKLYYTYSFTEAYEIGNPPEADPDGLDDPTVESEEFPAEGLDLTNAGTYVIKVLGVANGYENIVVTAVYQIEELAPPFINEIKNEDGTYTVSLQALEGASIAYTLDGSDPVRPATEQTLYTKPFQVTTPGWVYVNAIAYKQGCVTSGVRNKCLEVPVAIPEIAIEDILGGKEVSIETATEGAKIYYTLDGSEPDESDELYKETLIFDEEVELTLKAVAVVDESQVSNLEEEDEFSTSSEVALETIQVGKTKEVVSSQPAGALNKGDIISLYSATADADIYYTLDGSDPLTSATSKLYKNYFTMGDDVIRIQAYARSYGNEDSEVTSFAYARYGMASAIDIEQESVTLYANMEGAETCQLNVAIEPEMVTAEQLQWKSSNTSVVTVDKTGKLTAVAPGTATITASSQKVKDTCIVTVKNAVESMTLKNDSLVIKEDKGTLKLDVNVLPANASNAALQYTVAMSDREEDKKGVARIDENGVLTAIKEGVVKVTIEPVENLKNISPIVVYVTISNQRSYNTTYRPRLSESTITLNKKATDGVDINIYSLGNGTSITSVNFDESNRYAKYFDIVKDEENGCYEVSFTELGKTSLRNGTYRVPMVINTGIALGGIDDYEDEFTTTLKIQVKNSVPRITADSLRLNRYHSGLEYPLTIKSPVDEFAILGLSDA